MAGLDLRLDIRIEETLLALDAMAKAVIEATPDAVDEVARQTENDTRRILHRRQHPPDTPTPATPGEPPAWISGSLARSLRRSEVRRIGETWSCQIGPTSVYGRIQELGGVTGRGHHSDLDPRPYLKPAVEELHRVGFYGEVFHRYWEFALLAGVIP